MQATGVESTLSSSLDGGDPPAASQTKPLDACVICLEPVSERAVAVPCNHCSFDFLCLVSWLQERSKCPLCNTELSAVEYDWRAPHDFKNLAVPSTISKDTAAPNTPQATRQRRQRFNRGPRHLQRPALSQAPCTLTADAAISRRRYVYRHQLYSLHVGSNRLSHFRDFTPQTFSRSPELQSRARKWIRRELQVFDFLGPNNGATPQQRHPAASRRANNVEFLLEYIVAILRTVDIKGSSGKAQAMLQEFLGADNASLFCHELGAWLRSPYVSLADWDRHVQYRVKIPDFGAPADAQTNDDCSTQEPHRSGEDVEPTRQVPPRAGTFSYPRNTKSSIDARADEARRRYRPD